MGRDECAGRTPREPGRENGGEGRARGGAHLSRRGRAETWTGRLPPPLPLALACAAALSLAAALGGAAFGARPNAAASQEGSPLAMRRARPSSRLVGSPSAMPRAHPSVRLAEAPVPGRVRIKASLRRHDRGHGSTLELSVRISPTRGELLPPPLLSARLLYPEALDVQLSGLGIVACPIETLNLRGPGGCPRDSVMGFGKAVAEIAIKGEVTRETARLLLVRAAGSSGHLALTIVAYDEPAISAQILLPSVILPAARPFGGALAIRVPLVGTFPEGPDLSVASMKLTLGPAGLRYIERAGKRTTHYEPAGIPLAGPCPKGGYPFAVRLSFLGGGEASAGTFVRCERRSR